MEIRLNQSQVEIELELSLHFCVSPKAFVIHFQNLDGSESIELKVKRENAQPPAEACWFRVVQCVLMLFVATMTSTVNKSRL